MILTREDAKAQGYGIFIYDSGDWGYKDENGHYHLIRDGEELTKNVKAKQVYNPDLNGDWHYVDTEGKLHLIERNQ